MSPNTRQILEHEFNSGFLEFCFGALEDEQAVQVQCKHCRRAYSLNGACRTPCHVMQTKLGS